MMEEKKKSESFPKISHILLVRLDSKSLHVLKNPQTRMHNVE